MIIMNLIILVIFVYLAFCTLYNVIFAIAAFLYRPPKYRSVERKNRFVIFIPAYKEDDIILNTVHEALRQDYLTGFADVIVIADGFSGDTLRQLSQLPVKVIQVSFEKSTKARAIKYALQQLPDDFYQCILILDADNLLGPGCIEKANHAYEEGFMMIQLHRTAKNKNTPTAILDAISEEVGNTIHRKGRRALGLSATLIGSGMVFDYRLFKEVIMNLNIEDDPAEDRAINAEMLRQGYVCEYIEDAYVYDEKVQSNRVLELQRVRWISAQMSYVKHFWFRNPLKTLLVNAHYSDYAIQTFVLPRSMLLVINFIAFIICLLLKWVFFMSLFPGTLYWVLLFLICFVGMAISRGKDISGAELLKAFLSFPITFWSFLKALFKSSSAQKEFIHTPKEYTEEHSSTTLEN